jgi:hypothetical protein
MVAGKQVNPSFYIYMILWNQCKQVYRNLQLFFWVGNGLFIAYEAHT